MGTWHARRLNVPISGSEIASVVRIGVSRVPWVVTAVTAQ